METWYEEIGFYENPFSIKPGFLNSNIFGNENLVDTLFKKIKSGKVCYVKGDYGFGKTALLKKIFEEFKGKKFIYYSCNIKEGNINFNELIYGKSLINRIFKLKSSDMVLLLDEVHELGKRDCETLVDYYKKGYFKSIILVSKSGESKFTFNLKRLVGKNRFEIDMIDDDEAIKLVRDRIGDRFFTDWDIKKLFHNSKKNPRLLLRNCEDVCRKAMISNEGRVDEQLIDEVAGFGAASS